MAMTDLAKHSGSEAVSLSAIAERQQLSIAYLEQIFAQLRRAGLVESIRGRNGGYKLGREATGISIAEIMIAVDERTRMTRCQDLFGDVEGCLGQSKCLTHSLWHALGDHIREFLNRVTLQEVVNGSPIAAGPIPLMTGTVAAE
ncbi:MAG: Rrf2 family transcriptional regulator [Hyphomicrobiaceae bacterium]